MPQIDWYYHRRGCQTCAKSESFLAKAGIDVQELVDARKNRISPDDAVELARSAKNLVVAKGKRVVRIDLVRDAPTDEALKQLIVGPSGNLRAPTMRRGDTLFVGFNETEFGPLLASDRS